jgi:hypothetical protein
MAIWYDVWQFGVHSLWSFDIFSRFGTLGPKKSGNPALDPRHSTSKLTLHL